MAIIDNYISKNEVANLIGKDIQELSRYINYENINTYNNKVKFNNLHAIFYFKDVYSLAKDFEEIFYSHGCNRIFRRSLNQCV